MSTEVLQGTTAVPLTAHDRCDGCGSQAYVRVHLLDTELLFCMHHWQTPGTKEKLTPIAVHVHDETHKLTA